MKIITIVVPTYNEEENVNDVYSRIKNVFEQQLPNYQYEFLFIDNCSTDKTQDIITQLAQKDCSVKAIFNAKNFGFTRSTFYGLSQATGDCAVLIFADMQDPPETIPEFVQQWEKGFMVVTGVKNRSKENPLMFSVRKLYYKILKLISDVDHIEQFDGFGLYDQSFIQILKKLKDPLPYLRGIVAELGARRGEVFYEQKKRSKGKSNFNFVKLYDLAMLGITSYSKIAMRIATWTGFLVAVVSVIIAMVTFMIKLFNWNTFPVGMAALSIGVFFLGAVQLFFIGLLGEYIVNINTRIMNRPLVIEERRINFDIQQIDTRECIEIT